MKTIKVTMEMPSNIVDVEDPLFGFGSMLRDSFQRRVLDKAVDEAVKQIELPKITITAAEIKDKMLTLLAERALENEAKDD